MIKTTHDDATLTGFRNLADAMLGTDRNWEWIGPHASQRMFGIARERAESYATRHGGTARQMTDQAAGTDRAHMQVDGAEGLPTAFYR